MPKPWRLWVTGGAAAVVAAVAQTPALGAETWAKRSSPHSLTETARRIERVAREHGMPLFARLTPPALDMSAEAASSVMLVLGSDEAHTPVLQPTEDAALQLPLGVWVHEPQDEGGAEVQFRDPRWLQDNAALPPELADRIAALPGLIDAAIER